MESIIKKLHTRAKKRAKERNLSFEISIEFLVELMNRQEFKCELTEIPFDMSGKVRRNPFGPSIDRKDPGQGYIESNVRWILFALNTALGNWGDAQFRWLMEELLLVNVNPASKIENNVNYGG